jgi:hypothetical protein
LAVAFGRERTGIGGVALQRFAARVRAAESLGEHGVGGLILGCVLTLVAVLVGSHEGAVHTRGPAECSLRGRIDRRSGDGTRFKALATGLVQIGHPFIILH